MGATRHATSNSGIARLGLKKGGGFKQKNYNSLNSSIQSSIYFFHYFATVIYNIKAFRQVGLTACGLFLFGSSIIIKISYNIFFFNFRLMLRGVQTPQSSLATPLDVSVKGIIKNACQTVSQYVLLYHCDYQDGFVLVVFYRYCFIF